MYNSIRHFEIKAKLFSHPFPCDWQLSNIIHLLFPACTLAVFKIGYITLLRDNNINMISNLCTRFSMMHRFVMRI